MFQDGYAECSAISLLKIMTYLLVYRMQLLVGAPAPFVVGLVFESQ